MKQSKREKEKKGWLHHSTQSPVACAHEIAQSGLDMAARRNCSYY
jgi:hypothetical protein